MLGRTLVCRGLGLFGGLFVEDFEGGLTLGDLLFCWLLYWLGRAKGLWLLKLFGGLVALLMPIGRPNNQSDRLILLW